jgi:hypothetical protein
MTETIALRFAGTANGMNRLRAHLKEAGATEVTGRPAPLESVRRGARRYQGEIVGMTVEQATRASATYLAATMGYRVEINAVDIRPHR